MFSKILIANRGEIACRIIRTARTMGVATVAVYSEADSAALHVERADESVCIGPPASAQSYLVAERIVEACRETGADAVHPGYGFLSENAAFAETLDGGGVTFIGPPPKAITAMGDKITSKKIAHKAGVNTIPGHADVIGDAAQAVKIARQVGYPIMLKASAGGGGKGMRIAWDDEQCRDGFERATNEARSSFGDERVFIEKFIENPRHIEIQVLADTQGNALYLGERECSIQRRHQKVIEEAPSPFIDEKMRQTMGEQAVALVRAVGYVSAGTVEFIVDAEHNFYFLEMNTRLQVEHPVTELVTGLDLVELMIRIAAGEPLPFDQSGVERRGWAMESRVYAENPFRGFLPSTGRLVRYLPPTRSDHVRVDTGVHEGGEVSMYYDPMIAKLATWGETRDDAIQHMRKALNEYYIRGVDTNIAFLAAIMAHPRFVEGRLSTNFIDEEYPDGFRGEDVILDDPIVFICVSSAIHHRYRQRAAGIDGQMPGYIRDVPADWVVVLNGEQHPVSVHPMPGGQRIVYRDNEHTVISDWQFGQPLFRGTIDGEREVCLQVERQGLEYRLFEGGAHLNVLVLTPRESELYRLMPEKQPADLSRFLLSPMPGLLLKLSAEPGEQVRAGQELAVVEAMKMENVLRAARDGKIAKVLANPGDSLAVDQPIIEFD